MKFIGIDLHSNRFNICILDEAGNKQRDRFELNEDDLEIFYGLLDQNTFVIVEASTNTFSFVDLIQAKVKQVLVANTHKMKLISMVNRKTDIVDAEKLAIYLKMHVVSGEKLVPEVYIPEKTIRYLRGLFTTTKLLRKQVGATKNRVHSILKQNLFPFTKKYIFGKSFQETLLQLDLPESEKFQVAILLDTIDHLETQIAEVDIQIQMVGQKYEKEIRILTSMRGISVRTALGLIADIADISRFDSSKQLCSYLRSAPKVDRSNETNKSLSTNKFGRKLSITYLSQSCNHFRDGNPKLNRWYNKKEPGMKKGKIRMAIIRRVISEIYQMLKKEEYHMFREELNHEKKMKAYYRLLAVP